MKKAAPKKKTPKALPRVTFTAPAELRPTEALNLSLRVMALMDDIKSLQFAFNASVTNLERHTMEFNRNLQIITKTIEEMKYRIADLEAAKMTPIKDEDFEGSLDH